MGWGSLHAGQGHSITREISPVFKYFRTTNVTSNTIHGVYLTFDATDFPGLDEVPALDLFGTKEIKREWISLQDLKVLQIEGQNTYPSIPPTPPTSSLEHTILFLNRPTDPPMLPYRPRGARLGGPKAEHRRHHTTVHLRLYRQATRQGRGD